MKAQGVWGSVPARRAPGRSAVPTPRRCAALGPRPPFHALSSPLPSSSSRNPSFSGFPRETMPSHRSRRPFSGVSFPWTPTRHIAFLPFKMWLAAFLSGKPPPGPPTRPGAPLYLQHLALTSIPVLSGSVLPLDRDLLEGRDEFCSTTVSASLAQSLVPNGCSRKMN